MFFRVAFFFSYFFPLCFCSLVVHMRLQILRFFFSPYFFGTYDVFPEASKSSVSARYGIEGMAPSRVTQMADAADANRRQSCQFFPSTNATANAARKQSPAPVVSTTFSTLNAFWRTTSPPDVRRTEPLLPKVASTFFTPFRFQQRPTCCHNLFVRFGR